MAGCSSPTPSTPPGQFGQRLHPCIYPKYIPASYISPKPASPHGLSLVPCVAEGARDRPFQYHLGENVFNPHWEVSMLPDRLWLEKSEFAFQNSFFFFLVPEIKRNKVQTVQPQASCGLGIWHPNGLLCSRRCFLPYLGVACGSPDEFHCLPHHAVHEAMLESGLKVKKQSWLQWYNQGGTSCCTEAGDGSYSS